MPTRADGSFLTGTFADYLLPTTTEVPDPVILHMETPSPFTPLGAKGVGEGNCMSTPVCIANAVADALGVEDIDLPLVPAKLADTVARRRAAAACRQRAGTPKPNGDRELRGEGSAHGRRAAGSGLGDAARSGDAASGHSRLPRRRENLRHAFPRRRHARRRPGQRPLSRRRHAVRSRCAACGDAERLVPRARSASAAAKAASRWRRTEWRHRASRYNYDAAIGGKVASIGGRLLDGAARVIIGQFFAALARKAGGAARARASRRCARAAAPVREAAMKPAPSTMSAPKRSTRRSTCCAARAATRA